MKRYCGRDFSANDLLAINGLIEQHPTAKRAGLSRQVCVMFDWLKPDGGLKEMTCRVAMLRMQADGLITLPASQMRPRSRTQFSASAATTATDAQPPLVRPVHELNPLTLRQVAGATNSRLWNEYVARYHYLGYTPMAGSQMRYFVFEGERLVALLSFGASAWKLAARDRFIGWVDAERQKNLQLVVNNARFLILPWIQSKGLASKILAIVNRQLPNDWQQRYGYRPVLLETFVETPRHRGTCYKAANWINVGKTAGRGKKCHTHKQVIPIKDIWLYPLRKNFRAILGR
jgi:hypothetical protein